ncbi:hypothetical protein BD626DRAFT_514054 [Schizophyllum amplum]|uniref:Uncharacterized protein n=1 Tax=Schizophyllum amplum TaxID=97359 RepID=A0A550BYJ5_9AGAR|nr:hypothetical protein BD626DRAFT_514054 [Auriculariopsis ampla]
MSNLPTNPSPLLIGDVASLQSILMQVAVDVLFYGVQAALFIAAIASLARQTSRSLLLQTPIIILFLTSTMGTIAILIFYTIQMPQYGLRPTDIQRAIFQLSVVLSVTDRVNYLLSDFVVVWRAWVLWPDNRYVRALLALCMCGSTIGVIIEVYWAFQLYGTLQLASRTLLMMVPLLVTNMVTTVLMAARVWFYRRDIKRSLGKSNRTRVEGVLLLLVESGFVYCGLWIMFIVLRQSSESNADAYGIVKTAFHSLAGIYPTFIVLAVAAQRSTAESMFTSVQLSRPINFAPSDNARSDAGTSSDTGMGTGDYTAADTGYYSGDTGYYSAATGDYSAATGDYSGDTSTRVASEHIHLEQRRKDGDRRRKDGERCRKTAERSQLSDNADR